MKITKKQLRKLISESFIGAPDGTDFSDAGSSPPAQKQKKKQTLEAINATIQQRKKKSNGSVLLFIRNRGRRIVFGYTAEFVCVASDSGGPGTIGGV